MEPFLHCAPTDLALAALSATLALLVAASWAARRWWIGELASHWTSHIALVLLPLAALAAGRGDWGVAASASGFAVAAALPG